MSTKHTPTPWFIERINKQAPSIVHIVSRKGGTISDEVASVYCADAGSEQEANAKFIVKAVNCHDELLAALKEYQRLYEEVQPAGGWQGVYELGNAAIERAEAQQ